MANTPPPLPHRRSTPQGRDSSAPSNGSPRAGVAAALIAAAVIGICLLMAALVLSLAAASVARRDGEASTAERRAAARGERPPGKNPEASGEAASNAENASSADARGASGAASAASEGGGSDDATDGASGEGAGPLEGAPPAERSDGGEVSAPSESADETPPAAVPLHPGEAFGIDAVGKRIVYVVDCSTDLGRQGYATATDGVVASLRTLRSDQEFAVVLFADDVYPMLFPDLKEETLLPSAAARTRVEKWLAEFDREALGRSRAAPALEYALSLSPTDLFFVSGSAPDQETIDAITDQNGRTAIVHAVGIDVDATETLRSLARRNGGQFRDAR